MSRRLLLEEEIGSTSSSCSDKPMAKSSEAQNTSSAPSQQSNTAKVRHHEQCEPSKTCKTSRNYVLPSLDFHLTTQMYRPDTTNA